MDIVLMGVVLLYLHMYSIVPLILADAKEKTHSNFVGIEDLVTSLPGQPIVNFRHYSGYVTVNEKHGRALFYWFYEATTMSQRKPLVLWLNGGEELVYVVGPGSSSVGYGATQEIGPFLIDNNGRNLKFNSFSWNTEANLLFLESPIGVGFSYSNTSADYDNVGDEFTAHDTYAFLHKWFLKFPSFRNRSFYIAGESYAGKYIPELAEIIHDKNKDPSLFINLRGILLGNPETDDAEDLRGMVDYAWSHAIISDETHNTVLQSCDFYSDDAWKNDNCSAAMAELYRQYQKIDIYSLYTSTACTVNNTSELNTTLHKKILMPKVMGGYDACLDSYAELYYNRADVQKALHASFDGINLRNWTIANWTVYDNWSNTMVSVLPIYRKLIAAGLRIWVYSGDTDGRVPFLSTKYSLRSLGLPKKSEWKPWYHEKEVAGWFEEYFGGLIFATFRGAGHTVPTFKPSESLAFFASFLAGKPPPSVR